MVTMRGIWLGATAIGAALAFAPAAQADSSTDWLSSIDGLLSGEALPAASGLNLAISFDGYSLLQDGTATANTINGEYGLAIAYGDGASASAEGGTGNFALAAGTYAQAGAGGAAGSTGNDFNSAVDIGNNATPVSAGDDNGAFAGAGSLIEREGGAGSGSFDRAIDIGNNGSGAILDGAHAGSGGLEGLGGDGNHDLAIDIGNNSNGYAEGAVSVGGDHDIARYVGNATNDGAYGHWSYAGFGDGNIASSVGDNEFAYSGGTFDPASVSDHNIASVFDPFGTIGSSALAGTDDIHGLAGNFDLAAAFGDGFFPEAVGADHVISILPMLF